jgi:D-3-phosphoglycerate dehydrogenase
MKIVTSVLFDSGDLEYAWARERGYGFVYIDNTDQKNFFTAAKDADVVIIGYEKMTSERIYALERCKILGRYGIGIDNIDLEAASKREICVIYQPKYCIEEVALHALSLMLAASRQIVRINTGIRSIGWKDFKYGEIHRLSTQTVGLIGFGRIGQKFAEYLRPHGVRILGYDPFVDDETFKKHKVQKSSLEEVLIQSDYISLHCPLSEKTMHIINKETLSLMKPNAILVNVGRGACVKEQDLVDALKAGRMSGAALDVFETEPLPPDSPLWEMEQVIITNHMAGYSEEARIDKRTTLMNDIDLIFEGYWPENLANHDLKNNNPNLLQKRGFYHD